MSRSPRRPLPGAPVETVQPSPPVEAPDPADVPATTGRLGLGWRIALTVWLLGLVGLTLYELVGFGWKLLW